MHYDAVFVVLLIILKKRGEETRVEKNRLPKNAVYLISMPTQRDRTLRYKTTFGKGLEINTTIRKKDEKL